jgi:hypothetical protein
MDDTLRAGVDIRLVKDLLGHEDLKSTVVSTAVTDSAVLRLPWKFGMASNDENQAGLHPGVLYVDSVR